MTKQERDKDGFLILKHRPGGRFDKFLALKKQKGKKKSKLPNIDTKMPKDSDEFLDMFVDSYGVDAIENMSEVDLADYVYSNGINYALNVNVGRNIPWIEDGLKSVERRVLYIMYKAGLYNGKMDKVAGISGDMIKLVFPHGERSAEDTIYRLGRSNSMMIPYISPKGNFGNLNTMKPAASRYASASLSKYGYECFFSEMGTKYPIYDTKDNYKFSEKEPVYLISKYPNILMQWNLGIGKGAQAWLGAFNIKDILKTTLTLMDNPDAPVEIYPDTPLPVIIINKKELKHCFDKSTFKVEMRAPFELVVDKKRDSSGRLVDKYTIVFTALPVSVIGETIKTELQKIKEEDNHRSQKKLPEVLNIEINVSDIDDNKKKKSAYDDEDENSSNIQIIIEYEKGYDPHALAEKLYKCTSLAKTIGVRYVLVNDNTTIMYTPREILNTWITQRYDQKRRYYHQLALKAAKDKSRLEAICVILRMNETEINRLINKIRSTKDTDEAIAWIIKEYKFSEYQANCVMQISFKNLPKLDVNKIVEELKKAEADYKYYRKILADDGEVKKIIKNELEDGLIKYGKDRMAILTNHKTDKGIDPDGTKVIFYNNNSYFAIPELDSLSKFKDNLTKSTRMIMVKNSDQILIVGTDGSIKIVDGNAFNGTGVNISFDNLGISEVSNIIRLDSSLSRVVLVTSRGIGKLMDIDDITKSVKSKIIKLDEDETLADIVPVPSTANDNYNVVVCKDDIAYMTILGDYPLLKRNSAGNHMLKVDDKKVTRVIILPNTEGRVVLYTEFGYMKAVNTSALPYNRRKPSCVNMQGKTIYGGFIIPDSGIKLAYYDHDGVMELTATSDKMIKLESADNKNVFKFKPSTTIGSPVKVISRGRNEFYMFATKSSKK